MSVFGINPRRKLPTVPSACLAVLLALSIQPAAVLADAPNTGAAGGQAASQASSDDGSFSVRSMLRMPGDEAASDAPSSGAAPSVTVTPGPSVAHASEADVPQIVEDGLTRTNGFAYRIESDGSATLVKYEGASADVVVPQGFGEARLTAIANGAFKGNTTVRTVVVPDGVVSIGAEVFAGCTSLHRWTSRRR